MTTIPTIDLVDALAAEYADKSPSEILALALNQTGEIAISFSGAESINKINSWNGCHKYPGNRLGI